ncbi:hypothetical protein SteCoe_15108 [Stentor coeruleus]|uniref:Uncharacterized protein n=1 Tax=Stentor coeruleus TaxID=5963 RepID=A0A1R2C4H3_9CILI|nr:hypothetical protein SteCoe_15108 [Stentor coeruleus]
MNKTTDFQPLVKGSKIAQPPKIRKQSSMNLAESRIINSSFRSDQKSMPTCLPIARRLSVKPHLGKKTLSEKKLMKFGNTLIQTYEDPPFLAKKTYHNERLYWKKRCSGALPLLVIIFEGVVGAYFKANLWKEEKPSFVLRENFFSSILRLKKDYYVVLVSTYSRNVTKEIMQIIDKKANNFDAIYIQRHRKWHARHVHDITAILEDFKVKDKSWVMALSAIGIDVGEIKERQELQLIYDDSMSNNKKYLCYYAPTCEKDAPVTLLVPHIRLLNKISHFTEIANFLTKFKKLGCNFFEAFERYSASEKLKVFLKEHPYSQSSAVAGRPLHRFVYLTNDSFPVLKPSSSDYKVRIRKANIKFIDLINKK